MRAGRPRYKAAHSRYEEDGMPEKKIIAVVGSTGAQGGGLARAILNDPSSGFAARALTRDPGSERAKELAQRGARRGTPLF